MSFILYITYINRYLKNNSQSVYNRICYFTCFMDDEEMPDELNTREGQEICDSDAEDEHQAFLNQAKKDIESAACK